MQEIIGRPSGQYLLPLDKEKFVADLWLQQRVIIEIDQVSDIRGIILQKMVGRIMVL